MHIGPTIYGDIHSMACIIKWNDVDPLTYLEPLRRQVPPSSDHYGHN